MSILRKLSLLKEEKPEMNNENKLPIAPHGEAKETWFQSGEHKCRDASGSPKILKSCLEENFEKFKDDSRTNRAKQLELKKPFAEEQDRQKTELKKRETAKEIKEDEIDSLEKKIAQANQDIADVKNNPEKYGVDVDKRPKVSFYIGLVLLIPMTLYLFVFYISASYSAFFKDFTANTTILESIFDGQSISKAYDATNGGVLEVIFICTIPFVFMGLGYLIHMFQKNEEKKTLNTLKIIGLFLVTFIFDTLLAYQIEKNIYEVHKTLMSNQFDFGIAFQSPGFWIIIFSGFVVYVIWGVVFDFVMKEYANIDKIKGFIASKKKEKKNYLDRIDKLKVFIDDIKQEVSLIDGKIRELQGKLDGFIFESKAYLLYHTEFMSGWNLTIGRELPMVEERKNKLLEDCTKGSEEHLAKHELFNVGPQNIIYSKNN